MSFIVKGIDLPKDKDCINLSIYSNGDVYEQMDNGFYIIINAEAIQISKRHGDIKDGNEIIKRLEEKEKEPLYQHDTDDWWVGIIDAETVVYTAPTILGAEEVKDCTTCKYGKYNDRLGKPFCYNPEECEEWERWEAEE